MVQWLRISLPMQDTWVQSLVWEDSTCPGEPNKPMSHSYWARAPQPQATTAAQLLHMRVQSLCSMARSCSYCACMRRACAPRREAAGRSLHMPHKVAPAGHTQLDKDFTQQWRPREPKVIFKNKLKKKVNTIALHSPWLTAAGDSEQQWRLWANCKLCTD